MLAHNRFALRPSAGDSSKGLPRPGRGRSARPTSSSARRESPYSKKPARIWVVQRRIGGDHFYLEYYLHIQVNGRVSDETSPISLRPTFPRAAACAGGLRCLSKKQSLAQRRSTSRCRNRQDTSIASWQDFGYRWPIRRNKGASGLSRGVHSLVRSPGIRMKQERQLISPRESPTK